MTLQSLSGATRSRGARERTTDPDAALEGSKADGEQKGTNMLVAAMKKRGVGDGQDHQAAYQLEMEKKKKKEKKRRKKKNEARGLVAPDDPETSD